MSNDEIEMIYEPTKNNAYDISIFVYDFVENNKFKCTIIYKGKKYSLPHIDLRISIEIIITEI